VVAAGLLGLVVSSPGAAQSVPDDCLEPAGQGPDSDETLTNRLVPDGKIPDPVQLVRRGDIEKYPIPLEPGWTRTFRPHATSWWTPR